MAQDPKAQVILEELTALKTERSTFENQWRDVEEFVAPVRGTLTSGGSLILTPGSDRRSRIFDGTAIFANEQLASLLASQLINPRLKWLGLRTRDEELNKKDAVIRWLSEVRDLILVLINAAESRFHQAAHEFFLDLGAFGTGIMMIEEQTGSVPFIFRAFPILQVYIREDTKSRVDTTFILFKISARQAKNKYGFENLPVRIQTALKVNPTERFEFLHVIQPREIFNRKLPDSLNMPVESIHIAIEDGKVVRESGFKEMPALVARATLLSGEIYGRGPGLNLLPEIRMAQRVREVTIRGAQLAIAPALQATDDGVIGQVKTFPNAINIIRPPMSKNEIRPIQTGSRPDFGERFLDGIQANILRGFFLDPAEFTPLEPRVTAFATADRRDARFQRMTPLTQRLQSEWLAKMVDVIFAVLGRKKMLPELPAELRDREGNPIDASFTSPAAQAQLVSEADNMVRFIGRIAPALEFDPDASVTLNVDEYIRQQAINSSVSPKLLETPDRTKEKRNELAESRAAAAQTQEVGAGAKAALDLSGAVKNVGELPAQ